MERLSDQFNVVSIQGIQCRNADRRGAVILPPVLP